MRAAVLLAGYRPIGRIGSWRDVGRGHTKPDSSHSVVHAGSDRPKFVCAVSASVGYVNGSSRPVGAFHLMAAFACRSHLALIKNDTLRRELPTIFESLSRAYVRSVARRPSGLSRSLSLYVLHKRKRIKSSENLNKRQTYEIPPSNPSLSTIIKFGHNALYLSFSLSLLLFLREYTHSSANMFSYENLREPSGQIYRATTNRNEAVAIKFDKERPNYSHQMRATRQSVHCCCSRPPVQGTLREMPHRDGPIWQLAV